MGRGIAVTTFVALGVVGAIAACAEDPVAAEPPIDPPPRVTPEAGNDAMQGPSDAGVDAGPCDLGAPFGAPELLPISAAEDEQGAWVTTNGLFFGRTFPGVGGGIYFVKTESDGGFGDARPVQIPGLGDVTFPSLSSDGRVLYVRAVQNGGAGIFRVTRGSENDLVFGQPAALRTEGGIILADYAPSLGPDGLYYAQQVVRGQSKDYDLRRAKVGANGEVLADEALASLNTTFNDVAAQVTGDGLRVYFATDRLGVDGKGGFDVWTATRKSLDQAFGDAKAVDELGAKSFDIPVWVAPDGCTILVESDRERAVDVQHGTDLYVAKKPKR